MSEMGAGRWQRVAVDDTDAGANLDGQQLWRGARRRTGPAPNWPDRGSSLAGCLGEEFPNCIAGVGDVLRRMGGGKKARLELRGREVDAVI